MRIQTWDNEGITTKDLVWGSLKVLNSPDITVTDSDRSGWAVSEIALIKPAYHNALVAFYLQVLAPFSFSLCALSKTSWPEPLLFQPPLSLLISIVYLVDFRYSIISLLQLFLLSPDINGASAPVHAWSRTSHTFIPGLV